ncbi:MAG: winged helix-turn-helix transcriptional regulator, partial [Mesorhizobium sp.]
MIEAEIFRALADPTRRAVYERLAAGELTVSELRAGVSVSQPAVSQHLAVLRGAGLVIERRA